MMRARIQNRTTTPAKRIARTVNSVSSGSRVRAPSARRAASDARIRSASATSGSIGAASGSATGSASEESRAPVASTPSTAAKTARGRDTSNTTMPDDRLPGRDRARRRPGGEPGRSCESSGANSIRVGRRERPSYPQSAANRPASGRQPISIVEAACHSEPPRPTRLPAAVPPSFATSTAASACRSPSPARSRSSAAERSC
jgi:hypothetical protein